MSPHLLMRDEQAQLGRRGTLVERGEVIIGKQGMPEGVEQEDGRGLTNKIEQCRGNLKPACTHDAAFLGQSHDKSGYLPPSPPGTPCGCQGGGYMIVPTLFASHRSRLFA